MTDREVRDQLMTLLLAGHETTATGLAWTLDLLTRHPRRDGPHARRRRPVRARRGRRVAAAAPGRPARRPAPRGRPRVNGLALPAGTDVTPAIWLAHTRPDAYPDPYAFRPERFLDRPPSTYTWIPYGGGVRRCLGAAFAEMEMRIVLTAILARFDLPAAPRAPSAWPAAT